MRGTHLLHYLCAAEFDRGLRNGNIGANRSGLHGQKRRQSSAAAGGVLMNHTDNPIISDIQTIEGGRTMKFYEINDPYYALLKAEDKAEAEKIYIENVADTDDYDNFQDEEINEVSRDYALSEYKRVMKKYGETDHHLIMETFNVPAGEMLLWDGSLT